ncbi:hypothetical protein LCGC14_3087450, partial [marine sediment metagenome]
GAVETSVAYAASVDAVTAGSSFSNDLAMQQVRHGNQKVGMADRLEQSSNYTQPRQLTFGNRYDGAPTIDLREGYAVNVTDAENNRRVIIGPALIIFEYTETLQVLSLSTGKTKNHDNRTDQVYLQISNNQVSDIVKVQTADHVEVTFKVSYRVNFEGDQDNWFKVENYVKLLTDHARSMLVGAARKLTIGELYADGTGFVRDTILGMSLSSEGLEINKAYKGGRRGLYFEDNDMRVHDVEVLDVHISDGDIQRMIEQVGRENLKSEFDLQRSTRHLRDITEQEKINQEIAAIKHATEEHRRMIQLATLEEELAIDLAKIDAKVKESEKSLEDTKARDGIAQFDFEAP